jgi:hypothetical protein
MLHESDTYLNYVIFGVGVVRVPKPERIGAIVTRLDAFGIALSNDPSLGAGVGYTGNRVIFVPEDAADVLVEVGACTDGGMFVHAERALLQR